ncbi:hypothetical protein TNIN_141381 [Trichonephila inaurata madagascariensis]|uniref:Uncharacterized protein n=1 Tax=Trichonephila inaurata madagascariensis TaxID=2747483 RepID=A0A8X7C487_9ARAC|nr:hypothetical protein TNIN_141381 [Trichonephila inaurata madagascariensis]
MAYNLHFMFAVILRLYFVFNGKLIAEELSSLQRMHSKYVACSQKSLKSWIIIGSILGYITAFICICCMFWDKSDTVERLTKFYMLDLDIPEPYEEFFSVISITIICVNPILLFIGQDLAVVFICAVYQKLGCFISDSAQVLTVSYSEAIPTSKSVHNFLKTVNVISTSVLKIDRDIVRIYCLHLATGRTIHARSGSGPIIYRGGPGNDRGTRKDEKTEGEKKRGRKKEDGWTMDCNLIPS